MISIRSTLPLRHVHVSRLRNRVQQAKRALTLSSVEGPLHPPLETRTLSEYFTSEILEKHSSRPALICRNEAPHAHQGPPSRNLGVTTHLAWDFAEFDRHINALARGLLNMGVRRGDRVGVVMGNNSAYAMLQWACAHVGAILVTVNPAYRAHELVNTLKLVGVKHLFVVPHIRTSAYVEMLAHALPEMKNSRPGDIQDPGLPELRNLVVVDNKGKSWARLEKLGIKSAIDWREILMWREDVKEKDMQRDISASLKNDDVANLQFTSGTTGAPKAVSLTHSNLLNNGISIGRCMYLTDQDSATYLHYSTVLMSSLLLSSPQSKLTCFPVRLVLGNLAAWVHGASIVYPSEVFDPVAIIDTVAAEGCTALHGVPTHFINVLAEFDKRKAAHEHPDLSRLRTGIAAGSPIPIDLMKHLIARLNLVDLTNAYGMTETSPVSFQTTPADDITKRVETVGKVQPHVKAKLIDHHGNIVPVGTPGEICIAGYLLQKGYWEDEKHTKAAMKKDEAGTVWMHTGDEGIMDEEGYLRIVGRIKDIIIRGGENLFPVQIENALSEHDSVREAAVVSVPDVKYGEVVGAWIDREPGSSDSREVIRDFVAKSMNPQNAPTWVWFLGEEGTHDELPKTASGKVMKHVLRKWSKDLAHKDIGRVNGRVGKL
ncbi:putative acyl-CoA synthetase YngI [Hypsizygus marmoreus]|uniref:Acyl-CoA synthetase YngI n=1 Tax=Hypsizygus marmoreus TaxID=39966 RepID=A0A369KH78_HYPMA|nr:putative acyl-CoA synthetase YngI [Hypsizygus marmoreus]